MNKGQLIGAVAARLNVSRADASRAVDAVLLSITGGLREHEKVTIAGFGTFQKKFLAARQGFNPTTRDVIPFRASNTCSFRASDVLREAI